MRPALSRVDVPGHHGNGGWLRRAVYEKPPVTICSISWRPLRDDLAGIEV